MTGSTVKIIISAEIAERKVELGSIELEINEKLDESIRHGMQLAGKSLEGVMLQEIDAAIQKTVPETWKNVGRERRQMTSCMGTIQYARRIYQDDKGQRRTPLDEVIGLEKYSRYSLSVIEKGSYLASELAFREASDMLSWLIGDYISHSAIGRMVRKVGESYKAEEEVQLEQRKIQNQGRFRRKCCMVKVMGCGYPCSERKNKRQKCGLGYCTQVKG